MTTTTTKKELSPIETQVDEILKKDKVTFDARYLGKFTEGFNGEKWEHDKWYCVFSAGSSVREGFEFSMGLGNRVLSFEGQREIKRAGKMSPRYLASLKAQYMIPVKPTAASVLYSLLLDATALEESFPNWCANFGYEEDSRKALDIYDKCCQSGKQVNHVFDKDVQNELREALQDY